VSIAHAGQIVLISAESLRHCLGLEGAVAIVDNLPNHVVLEHVFVFYY